MGLIIALMIAVALAATFAFRYYSLKYALHRVQRDLERINSDLTQNQALHQPMPMKPLLPLLQSINRMLKETQEMRMEAEGRERVLRRQIENISHDLRTPLTVILGYLKLNRQAGGMTPEANSELAENLEIIEKRAETLKKLLDQFYEYSRINAGDMELKLERLDLSRSLREFIAENYRLLQRKELEVEIEIPDHPVWVLADESALERIYLNLLQNAIRYAESRYSVRLEEFSGEKVSLRFANDTSRLSEANLPYLFDRFYKEDSSRPQGGTGLGLTIAKALAEAMGAELRAEMEPLAIVASGEPGDASRGQSSLEGTANGERSPHPAENPTETPPARLLSFCLEMERMKGMELR